MHQTSTCPNQYCSGRFRLRRDGFLLRVVRKQTGDFATQNAFCLGAGSVSRRTHWVPRPLVTERSSRFALYSPLWTASRQHINLQSNGGCAVRSRPGSELIAVRRQMSFASQATMVYADLSPFPTTKEACGENARGEFSSHGTSDGAILTRKAF